jgi:hypothetical protein
MSLTDLLTQPGPVRDFVQGTLPHVHIVNEAWRRAGPPALLPRATSFDRYPFDLVGMAFDYRLRYFFGTPPTDSLVAGAGARRLSAAGHVGLTLALEFGSFAHEVDGWLARERPVGRLLDAASEAHLARICFVLSLYEAHARRPAEECNWPRPADVGSDLLGVVPDAAVVDLVDLATAFALTHGHLLALPHVANPRFAGTPDVGGADADIVIGSTLIEIKTTLRRKPLPWWTHQLAGYVLLDYQDQLAITDVGFLLTRVPRLLVWPVGEFFGMLAGRRVDVARLRANFRNVLSGRSAA